MFALNQYPLPYDTNSLEPYISQETIDTHHGKHVATYIANLNKLIENTPYENATLVEIIQATADKPTEQKIFNNAAQIYNHQFFFNGMCPNCTTKIPDEIIELFGSKENFKQQFKDYASALFGSGYTWLVRDGGKLKIINLPNAETPITKNMTPIMTLDVWEHAYYLDYKNRRTDFIDAYLDNLVNWNVVVENLKQ